MYNLDQVATSSFCPHVHVKEITINSYHIISYHKFCIVYPIKEEIDNAIM